ncbi:hypothetical protein UFOVP191_62 [uncultured Caudovirales phage]|uniref:Uncharacterized protein n=1 Tax=uncultured Caudovirales phage TaxID=2100421 RepID=A0A6J7WJK6_9CAUD|nr:hypothetical protein UFOVP191_62 [uncultured Caudovirales phage]
MIDYSTLSNEELMKIAGGSQPLSVRNNNPGNLRPVGSDSGFQQFASAEDGMNAMQRDLQAKVSGNSLVMKSKFGAGYTPTIENVISTWAPPSENNTAAYINDVSRNSGISPTQPLSVADVQKIAPAMIKHEGGDKASAYYNAPPDLSSLSNEELMTAAGIKPPQETVATSAAAIPTSIKDSFLSRAENDFARRKAQIGNLADQAVAGDISKPEALARSALKMAQLLPDTAGNVLSAITPDVIENPIKQGIGNAASYLANTGAGRSVVGAVNDFNQNHPVASGRIGSTFDALNLVAPLVPVGGKSVANRVTDVATDAAQTALPVVQKAGQVAADLRVPLNADKALLQNMGVRMTTGQRAGGVLQAMENKATSVPIVGDAIGGAYKRGIDDFNRGVVNEVTKSIGSSLPKNIATGQEAISFAKQKVKDAYDTVLPKMTGVVDKDFFDGLDSALQKANNLPQDKIRQVNNILADNLLNFVDTKTGSIIGKNNKEVMQRLNKNARTYMSSADPDQRLMGEIFNDVKNNYSSMLLRNNPPALGKELANADFAYAKYVRLRNAGVAASGTEGVFTPAQLMGAVKKADNSVGKGAMATGDALMQDIATAGQNVLPNKIPNSGTAERIGIGAILGGGLGLLSPAALAGGALATAAYTKPGQAVIRQASKIIRK